jgi:hypothetical protein
MSEKFTTFKKGKLLYKIMLVKPQPENFCREALHFGLYSEL